MVKYVMPPANPRWGAGFCAPPSFSHDNFQTGSSKSIINDIQKDILNKLRHYTHTHTHHPILSSHREWHKFPLPNLHLWDWTHPAITLFACPYVHPWYNILFMCSVWKLPDLCSQNIIINIHKVLNLYILNYS